MYNFLFCLEDVGSDSPTPKVTPKKAQESSSAPAVLQQPKVRCTCGATYRPTNEFTSADLPLKQKRKPIGKQAKKASYKTKESRSTGLTGVDKMFQGSGQVSARTNTSHVSRQVNHVHVHLVMVTVISSLV